MQDAFLIGFVKQAAYGGFDAEQTKFLFNQFILNKQGEDLFRQLPEGDLPQNVNSPDALARLSELLEIKKIQEEQAAREQLLSSVVQ